MASVMHSLPLYSGVSLSLQPSTRCVLRTHSRGFSYMFPKSYFYARTSPYKSRQYIYACHALPRHHLLRKITLLYWHFFYIFVLMTYEKETRPYRKMRTQIVHIQYANTKTTSAMASVLSKGPGKTDMTATFARRSASAKIPFLRRNLRSTAMCAKDTSSRG